MPQFGQPGVSVASHSAGRGARAGLIATALVLLVGGALVISACSKSNKPATATTAVPGASAPATADSTLAPAATGTTMPVDPSLPKAWSKFELAVGSNGLPTRESAIVAAAIAFGPIEGVDAPQGAPGGDFSASGPFRWLVGHWDSLDPKLQQAFRARFRELFPVAPGATTSAGGGTETARQAMADPFVDSPGAAKYRAAVDKYVQAIGGRLGYNGPPIKTAISVPHKSFNDYFHASQWDVDGNQYEGCWKTVSSLGETATGQDLEFGIAHEVFHCYQFHFEDYGQFKSAPMWVHEGEASWVGLAVAGATEYMADDSSPWNLTHWRGWLQKPWVMLFDRSFDAVGFYTIVQDAGANVWPALIPMATAKDSPAAYGIATGGRADDVAKRWASSLFRDGKLPEAWNFKTGVGLTGRDGSRPPIGELAVSNGQTTNAQEAFPYAASLNTLSGTADVVSLQASGVSRIADEAGLDQAPDAGSTTNLCFRPQGCTCPEGSQGQPTTRATPPLRWAIGGGATGSKGTAQGTSLDDWCKKKPTPTPPPPTTTTVPSGGLCRIITADDARLLRPDVASKPVEAELSPGSGNCFYAATPNGDGVVGAYILTRPTAALAAGDYPLGYQCTNELSGISDRAGTGTAPDGTPLGCLLKGRTIVIINTNGSGAAMPEVLRRIAARL